MFAPSVPIRTIARSSLTTAATHSSVHRPDRLLTPSQDHFLHKIKMAAETAVLVTIATSLASGLLKEASKKAVDTISQTSIVSGLGSAIFKGLEPDLLRLQKELCKLEAVLRRAQSIDPMRLDNCNLVLLCLASVKEAAFLADNLFDEMTYEKTRTKVVQSRRSRFRRAVVPGFFFPKSDTRFAFRTRFARKVKEFMSLAAEIYKEAETTLKLVELLANAPSYQTSTALYGNLREIRANPDTSVVLGREVDEELIVAKLCSPNNDCDLPVVAIVGRSGVGKTTLARMVYDSKTVAEQFGKRAWIFVSENFNLHRFFDEMLQSVTGQSHNLSNIGAMEDTLQESLKEEKKGYLLVLDDVWNADEQLWLSVESSLVRISGFARCRVLVTTQSFDVARKMKAFPCHELKVLGDAEAWEFFKKLAFANKSEEQISDLDDVGKRVLSKCEGLPLAIKTLGSLLGSMNDRSQWESVERSEIWGLSLERSNIMPWLLISFHHIPNATMKQCFAHCSIIMGKGTFVPKSELIQAWMAQGYIQLLREGDMSMEDIGETYVSNLVANGLLQTDIEIDSCSMWMHDLVHDLARFISKDNTCWIPREAHDLHTASEAEHIRIFGEGNSGSHYNLPKGKTLSKLRTLICSRVTISLKFSAQAKFLHDLRLIDCNLEVVPDSIGRLKHLRYLSLAWNPFKYLPESIGTLFNLQTIDLEDCDNLVELPQQITMLLNLRHIFTSGLMKLPKGMGQLTYLRTLHQIKLRGKGRFDVTELKSFPFLSGDVEISGLRHISCKEDAVEANFKTKARIRKLGLQWSLYGQREANHDEEIMDGLHPHSNLKGICVQDFGGKKFSSWLFDMNNLKTLDLRYCNRCEQLPALGQLGSLEEISITGMHCIEVIGIEFYHDKYNSDMSRRIILFPRLKSLHLEYMTELRDWVQPSGSAFEVFPCLEKLEIKSCPLLVTAPTCFPSLKSLCFQMIQSEEPLTMILTNNTNLTDVDISGVDQLTSVCHLLLKCSKSLGTIKISYCKELRELCPLQCMASLEDIQVTGCHSLASFPDIEGLLSLRSLDVCLCSSLRTIPGLESCVLIEKLSLKGNRGFSSIPELANLTQLASLKLTDFSQQMALPEWLSCLPSLRELEIGGFSQEQYQLDSEMHRIPKCLKRLTLSGWPNLNSVPSEIRFLSQLEKLAIIGLKTIERLPEELGQLSSLEHLLIVDCGRLKYLPPLESCTRLRILEILGCHILEERCNKDGGEEWPNISHIAVVVF